DRTGAREHGVERLRRRAEVLAPVPGSGRPSDQPGSGKEAGRPADRTTARVEGISDLGGGLLGRIADEEVAPHPARHWRHADRAEELAHHFDELGLAGSNVRILEHSEVSITYDNS